MADKLKILPGGRNQETQAPVSPADGLARWARLIADNITAGKMPELDREEITALRLRRQMEKRSKDNQPKRELRR